MEEQLTEIEMQDRQRAKIKSGIAFLILFAVLVLPIMSYQNPPPEREGVLVRLGGDFGQGPDNSSKSDDAIPPPSEKPAEVKKTEEKKKPKKETSKPVEKKVVTDDHSKELAIKKAKDKKAREDKRKADAAAAEAQRQADAKARREAAAEAQRQAERDAANSMDFGIKNNKDGAGGGNDGKPGTSGSKDGSPDGMDKLGSGNGKVGGGLGSRGRSGTVPRLNEKSNKAGTVVVRICVNSSGKVTSASVTQSGTTIQDAGLHTAAIRNAKLFKFKTSSIDKQCGTVTYKFKVH